MTEIWKAGVGAALSIGLVAGTSGMAEAQVADATDAPQITIELTGDALGEATLTSAGEDTEVALTLRDAPADAPLSALIVSGVCAEGGEVIAQLGEMTVSEGQGQLNASLPIDLSTISSAPVAVEVRGADAGAIACGQHAAVTDVETPAAAEEPAPMPFPQSGAAEEPMPFPAPADDVGPASDADPAPAPMGDPADEPAPFPAPADEPAPFPAPTDEGAPMPEAPTP